MKPVRHLALVALACPLVLAGCGASSTSGTQPSTTATSTTVAQSAAPSGASLPGSSTSRLDDGLGEMPSFLPSNSTGATAHGTVDDPALSYPGGPVVVTTQEGDVTIHLDGPKYPDSTKVGAESVDCTFTAVFEKASATIHLGSGHFDVYDHAGTIHPLKAKGLPTTITPGQKVTVTLTATLPSGQGLVRWFPSGSVSAAAWDYVAETD